MEGNSRGGSWRPIGRPNNSSASWEMYPIGKAGAPGKPHWDLDSGTGVRTRFDELGSPISPSEAHPASLRAPSPETIGDPILPNANPLMRMYDGSGARVQPTVEPAAPEVPIIEPEL